MKRFLLLLGIIATTLLANNTMAYDFSAVCSTGQTLYYNITSNEEPYTVEVTYQIEGSYSNNYTYYETYPTGDLEIPESVEYNSITYSVTSIGNKAFNNCSELISVTIPNSVMSIGYDAFYECSGLTAVYYTGDIAGWCGIEFGGIFANPLSNAHNLYVSNALVTDLVIPSTVTTIKNYTFKNATCLTSITIGNLIDSIGWSAFEDCSEAASLTLGNSVSYIGGSAFAGCSRLTGSLTIPVSILYIDGGAFYGCDGITSVNYTGDIEGWCKISFGTFASNPITYAHNLYINNELLTNLIIPESITGINDYAFTEDTCITSLTIHNSITRIGEYAFDSCSALTSITMGTGVESIGENAFRNTGWYNNQSDGILYLGNWCFGYKGEEPTGDLVIEERTKGILGNAFYNFSGITSVTIPSSVESIEGGAFSGLGEIILNFNATNCTLMGGDEDNPVFLNTTITTLNIGENVRTIPDYAFYICGGLTSVTIPDSVNRIGEEAFYYVSELTDITLGTGIKHIGSRAFKSTGWYDNQSEGILYLDNWCLGYKGDSPTGELTIAEGTLGIADAAFNNCEITSVTIPNSVTSIGGTAFGGCTSLASITIGTGVTHIGLYAFYNTEWYNSQAASILYLDNWCIGYKGEGNMTIENLVIQDGTIGIASYAFYDGGENTSIKSVTIPNSVINIDEFAFAFCTGITDVTIGSNAENIEDEAFRFCENITSIQIFSNTPPTLGNDVFPETAYNTATVWVPIGASGSYRNNSQWRRFTNIRELPYFWSCDFEGDETWTFGNDSQGNVQWQIVTPETYPSNLISGTNAYFKPFVFQGDTLNDTPEHWAFVDLISELDQFGGPGQVEEAAWIEFSGIDLVEAAHPQLIFNQMYRPLNRVETLIRVSIDGGATWTDHIVNEDIASNEYAPVTINKGVPIFEAAEYDNVIIRFQMNGDGSALQGYGWQIDDIKIVEAPAYDLSLKAARISMFGYSDYSNEEYQIYDPYAQSPRKQWLTDKGYAAFNIEVENYGYEIVSPKARVKIFNPNGDLIYDQIGETPNSTIEYAQTDTIDIADVNNTVFHFDVENEDDIFIGRYNVEFQVFSEGNDDADSTDNFTSQYFYITDKTFSMSYDEPTSYYHYHHYTQSSSGDEYGTVFDYYYEPENDMEVDAYIDSHTTIGTEVQALIYEWNDNANDYVEIQSSESIIITENMLGTWVNFPLADTFNINISDTADKYSFLVSIRGIWEDGDTIAIGSSDMLTSNLHKSLMKFIGQNNTWYYGGPQLAIRVRENDRANSGESVWEEQNTHFATENRASYNIEIVDPQNVWFTTMDGTDGSVALDFGVTNDGGATWSPKTFSYDSEWLPIGISAISGTTAWTANYNRETSSSGAIFKTTDGGETWTRQGEELYQNSVSFLNVIHFFNENEGYVQGDPVSGNFEIYRTEDGGETWTAVSVPSVLNLENGMFGIVCSTGDISWFGTSMGRIYKTSDKGATWTVLSTGTTKMISEMSWADEMNGAVTVANYDQTTGQPSDWQFLRTTDGGETWVAVNVEENYFSSFSLVPGTPGMIVASKSSDSIEENFSAYSTDWGTSWDIIDDSIRYIQVRMYDINTGWAGGFNRDENNGGIYKWSGIELGLHFTSPAVCNVDEDTIYRYTVVAQNENDCDITITMTEGPDWLTLTQNGDEYVLTGNAPIINANSEDFYVQLTATDCEESKTQSFTITVSKNSGSSDIQALFTDASFAQIGSTMTLGANEDFNVYPVLLNAGPDAAVGIFITEIQLNGLSMFNDTISLEESDSIDVNSIYLVVDDGFSLTAAEMDANGFTGTFEVCLMVDYDGNDPNTENNTVCVTVTRQRQYTITALANNDEYGSVSGSGTYDEGSTVILTAIPYDGNCFLSWEDDENADNPRTITVTSDSTFIAIFSAPTHIEIDTTVTKFVTIGDHTFYAAGQYSFVIPVEIGCDTIVDLNLHVLDEPETYDISPNPAKSVISISSEDYISHVEFYTSTGRPVMQTEINAKQAEINVEGLVPGIYFVRLYGEEGNLPTVQKFIKE